MQKFKRFFVASVVGMLITGSLVLMMVALISLNHDEPVSNLLTTQIKVSSRPAVQPANDVKGDDKTIDHMLPAKKTVAFPVDPKALKSQIISNNTDGKHKDPFAASASQKKLMAMSSKSQASVKLAGKFNVNGPDPKYPTKALLAGKEGWVDTMIFINRDGTVDHIDIIGAGPEGVFENAVIDAVSEWQIQLEKVPEEQLSDEYFHRFEFKINDQ